jgi:hypothetical protein
VKGGLDKSSPYIRIPTEEGSGQINPYIRRTKYRHKKNQNRSDEPNPNRIIHT